MMVWVEEPICSGVDKKAICGRVSSRPLLDDGA